jgi:DNA polymerase-3 subunit alpha
MSEFNLYIDQNVDYSVNIGFMTVEDLYGSTEIIVFDSCYSKAQNILFEENIVLIEGRLSIREDDDVKIVANSITEFNENTTINNEVDFDTAFLIAQEFGVTAIKKEVVSDEDKFYF